MAGIKERNGGLCTRAVCGHYSACFTEGPIKVSVFGFDEVGMMLFSIAKDSARDFNDVKKSPRGGGGAVQACATLERLSKFISEYSHVNTRYLIVINKFSSLLSSHFSFSLTDPLVNE